MRSGSQFALVLVLMSLAVLACTSSAPTGVTPQLEAASTELNVEIVTATPIATSPPTDLEASPELTVELATATVIPIPVASPLPTIAPLQLEIVQSQAWTDRDGNVRVNVLFRNPYDFPVSPASGFRASVLGTLGAVLRDSEFYFLDGISGGVGFLLAGETVAATACFTCEAAPLPEEWGSVEFVSIIKDATGSRNYSTQVEATITGVSFDGDSPIFWITGTVTNNSDAMLSRISARVLVFDQDGNLVGAGESSAWDVGPGATANISGYGIGAMPVAGFIEFEASALGVTY